MTEYRDSTEVIDHGAQQVVVVNKRLRRNDAPGPNKLERWAEIALGAWGALLVIGMVAYTLWATKNNVR